MKPSPSSTRLQSHLRSTPGTQSMANLNGLIQQLSNHQSTEQPTRKGVSGAVRIDNLFIIGGVDSVRVDVFRTVG